MKKFICILLVSLFITGCACTDEEKEDRKEVTEAQTEFQKRVEIKPYIQGNFCVYEIVVVDGQEYLSSSRGGLVKLESNN